MTSSSTAYFESTRQQREVRDLLAEGAVPVKYAYVGSGAIAHQKLSRTAGYRKVTGAGEDELRALLSVLPLHEIPTQIAEVGLGTGVHTASFLRAMKDTGQPTKRFLGLDFSETLLDIGSAYLKDGFAERLAVTTQFWDVETSPTSKIETWRRGAKPVLVCTLGGTPVAFESSRPALAHLYRSMRENDLLLYSLILRPEGVSDEELLEPYQNETFRAAVKEPLYAVGFADEDFDLEFSVKDNSIISEAVIRRDMQLDTIDLCAGQRIRNFVSHRFTHQEIDALFTHSGWNVLNKVDTDASHVLIIARRQKTANVAAKIDMLLPVSADWMTATAPLACTAAREDDGSCSWYHGVWQYLRLFGLVSSPTWHDTFYQRSLSDVLKEVREPAALVSGTADYSMLAYVLEAIDRVGAVGDVSVVDRCPTPLIACQWYANKIGANVSLHPLDIKDAASLQTSFDLIVADAFLTRFDPDEVHQVLLAWRELLNDDGSVVTTVRIHGDESPILESEIEHFVRMAAREADHRNKELALPMAEFISQTEQYARQMVSANLGTTDQILRLFETHNFAVTSYEIATVRGELRRSRYLRIVAQKKRDDAMGRPQAAAALSDAMSKEHVIPLKFAYTGSAAQKHLELAQLDSYKEVTDAAKIESKLATTQQAALEIRDLGPGDGQHSRAFLHGLMRNGQAVASYVGLDFSDELAVVAEHRVRAALTPTIAFEHWDIEAAARKLGASTKGSLMVTFLGQTLGNVEDPLQTLRNIRNSVAEHDQLLLSVALQSPHATAADYVRPYQNVTFTEAILEPLRMVGLRVEQGELSLVYEDGAVVGKFMLTKEQNVEHPLRPTAVLPKGTVIRCFMSRRFRPEEIERMLRVTGWREVAHAHQSKGTIGVYLLRAV